MALKVYPWTVYVPLAEPELPPPVRTPVTIEVASVDPAFWSNLQDKLIQTSIELEINVDGPASQGNRLLYIAPATVHASNLEPDTFGMGTQRVRLNVEAKAIDGESEIVLAYHFAEAAEKNDAIKLDVPHDPVEIHIPSPGRLQLIPILGNGNVLKSWSCTTEANFSDIEFTTVLSGQLSEAAAKNAGEILIKANGQEFSGQLYEPTAVRIPLVWRGQLFRAEKQNLRVELRPTGGLSAIVDSANFQIAVEHPALFTLWLWKYGVWVVVFLATALSVSFVTSIARRKPKFSFVNPVS
jgi:hypothetical protein